MNPDAASLAAVRLRPVGTDEAEVLAVIHAACFDHPWDAQALGDLLAGPGVVALAAVSDAGPLGFVLARVVCDEAEILTLAVRPAARANGVGRLLVQAASREAEVKGAGVLWLEVAQDNAAALSLYHRCGFEPAGRRAGYYPRSAADALLLRRALNTASA